MHRTAFVFTLAVLCGCAKEPAARPTQRLSVTKVAVEASPHLHNLLLLTPAIYSGSEPQGEEAFAELAKLGVKVIVSVDGAKPDVENARKHGLRYVHIPIGYDGIPAEAGLAFARLVCETSESGDTLYVHCHHGKHRGPAAAAAICIAAGAADNESAKEILITAGTSKDYPGLWRDVASYKLPPANAKLPELVETAKVHSLTAAMSSIDRGFDNLKLSRDGGWKPLADHPDIEAAQEAIIVREAFHESGRNLTAGFGDEFRTLLREAEALTTELETQLKANDTTAATQTMIRLEASCKQCHTKHRN
jgi:hypothetical protein